MASLMKVHLIQDEDKGSVVSMCLHTQCVHVVCVQRDTETEAGIRTGKKDNRWSRRSIVIWSSCGNMQPSYGWHMQGYMERWWNKKGWLWIVRVAWSGNPQGITSLEVTPLGGDRPRRDPPWLWLKGTALEPWSVHTVNLAFSFLWVAAYILEANALLSMPRKLHE